MISEKEFIFNHYNLKYLNIVKLIIINEILSIKLININEILKFNLNFHNNIYKISFIINLIY